MADIFKKQVSRNKIKNMVATKIVVDGMSYDFDAMIENEIVSDFPLYSHRMRDSFVRGAQIIDDFLKETDGNLYKMEQNFKSDFEKFKTNKENEISEYLASRKNEHDTWYAEKQRIYSAWYSARQDEITKWLGDNKKTVNTRVSQMDARIADFDSLKNSAVATEAKVGLISERRVKELADSMFKFAKEDTAGKISEKRIKEVITTQVINPRIATNNDVDNNLIKG